MGSPLILVCFTVIASAALLHVAAKKHPDVESEHVPGFAIHVNGEKFRVVVLLRKLYPNRTFSSGFRFQEDLSDIVSIKRAGALLEATKPIGGWTRLKESFESYMEDVVIEMSVVENGNPELALFGTVLAAHGWGDVRNSTM
jgi:hypothetical protein